MRALPNLGAMVARTVMRPNLQVARNLALLWFGQIMTKGVAFIAFAVLARRLFPEDYGAVEYAMGLSTLAALAIDGGLGSVGVRRLTQKQQSVEELVALIPAAQFCIAAIIAPTMIIFTYFFAHDRGVLPLTCAIAFSVMLTPWKQDWLFQANGMMVHIVTAQTIRVLSFMAGTILLVHNGANVVRVGLVEIASVSLATLYMMVMQHRLIVPLRTRFAFHKLIDLLKEGVSIGLGAICWALFQYAPLLILAAVAGMTETAYFGAAHRLGVSLVTFSWIYHFNLYPVISRRVRGDPAALVKLTSISIRASAWSGIGLALCLTLLAQPLLALLFGPKFEAAAPSFSILVWTFPLTLLSGHARWILIAARRGNDMLIAQVAGVAIAIPAAWLLIGPFGAPGAAMAMVLACALVWAVSQYYARLRGHDVAVMPALPPMIAAAIIIAVTRTLGLDPFTACAGGMAMFALAAFIIDRHVLTEIRLLTSGHGANQPISPEAALLAERAVPNA